jgi:hypothetical protein
MSEEKREKAHTFWAVLLERALLGHAVDAVLDVAQLAAIRKYTRISVPYMRTDMARNRIVASFMEVSKKPDDVLVMLDGDHMHPPNVIEQLVCYDPEQIGVIGALYFRRGEPYDPLFFVRHEDKLRNPAEFAGGLVYECTIVATGAIAIRRWVFEKLEAEGLGPPFFQYTYPEDNDFSMTEDVFFGLQCEKAGIPHYVDTSVKTPHLAITSVTQQDWESYVEDHPSMIKEDTQADEAKEN